MDFCPGSSSFEVELGGRCLYLFARNSDLGSRNNHRQGAN